MQNLNSLNNNERIEVIQATSARIGLSPAIVEKDYWICIALDYLFGRSPVRDQIAFKGGTSLSKGYGLIERMSEDIDIILDWRLLGYGYNEPLEERSNKKQKAFIEEIRNRAAGFLKDALLKQMVADFSNLNTEVFSLRIEPNDPQTIRFRYPQSFSDPAILQEIRIEAGALAAWTPAEKLTILSYIESTYSDTFMSSGTGIRTVLPERTFWEKATILHKEAFREEGMMPSRYSRHYYDVYALCKTPVKNNSLSDIELLDRVVSFKERIFRSSSAHYELARPGTLRLLPPDSSLAELKADYAAMRRMIFGEYPSLSEILDALKKLEDEINSL